MKHLFFYILSTIFSLIISSCGKTELSEIQPVDVLPKNEFKFTINMVIDNQRTSSNVKYEGQTKSTNDSQIKSTNFGKLGNNFETWIYENKLHVLIYSGTNSSLKYIGEIEEIIPGTYSSSGDIFTLNFTGKTALDLQVGTSYRFMIIANSSVPIAPDFLNNPTYNLENIDVVTGAIPLWGVTTYTIEDTKVQYIPSTELVRAVSKMELVLSDDLIKNGFTFTKVQLTNYAEVGNVFPKKWQDSESTDELTKSNLETNLFLPNESKLNHTLPRNFQTTGTQNTDFVAYVPEYTIPETGEDKVPFIDVTVLKDGITYTFDKVVMFNDPKFYSHVPDDISNPNKFHNIVRNHNYKFIVTSISAGHTVELKCNVLPWTLSEENLDYENYISLLSDGQLKWSVPESPYQQGGTDGRKKVFINDEGITCTFGLSTPKEATWYAVLVPISGSFEAFSFVEDVNGSPTKVGLTTRGPVGSLHTLRIVQESSSVKETTIMKLKIYVKDINNKTFVVKNELLGGEYYIVQTVK